MNFIKKPKLLALTCSVLSFSPLTISCSRDSFDPSEIRGLVDSEAVQWPDISNIPVCWEQAPSDFKAVLKNVPPTRSAATRLNVAIRGDFDDSFVESIAISENLPYLGHGPYYVTDYVYKVGPSDQIDCEKAVGYSKQRSIEVSITDDISQLPDGEIKLCVKGFDDRQRSQAQATVVTWVKDRTQNEPYDETTDFPIDYALYNKKNRDAIKHRISTQYARAGFRFTGWEDCSSDREGIRIAVNYFSVNMVYNEFGVKLNGIKNGMWLSWNEPRISENLAPGSLYDYHFSASIHEFGHALGLHHEMNRHDETGCHGLVGEKGTTAVGAFDPLSVMSYCHIESNDRDGIPTVLSESDIRTLRAFYNMSSGNDRDDPIQSPVPTFARLKNLPNRWWYLDQAQEAVLKVKVEGPAYYRHKIGLNSEIDCRLAEGYSEPTEVTTLITDLIKTEWFMQDLRLCVLGGTSESVEEGLWQDLQAASNELFRIMRSN